MFTNFGYFALGVPRNRSAATNDPTFFDLGLCGPVRTDLTHRTYLCGTFKVPTLRNVALTAPYFHNGAVATLDDAVSFYATRDTDPARWYPVTHGVVSKFNDLPAAYHGNVNQQPPFGPQPGQPPRLSAQDVRDLTAFLHTRVGDLPMVADGWPSADWPPELMRTSAGVSGCNQAFRFSRSTSAWKASVRSAIRDSMSRT